MCTLLAICFASGLVTKNFDREVKSNRFDVALLSVQLCPCSFSLVWFCCSSTHTKPFQFRQPFIEKDSTCQDYTKVPGSAKAKFPTTESEFKLATVLFSLVVRCFPPVCR